MSFEELGAFMVAYDINPETISSSAKHPTSIAPSPTSAAPAARSSWTSKNKKAPQISRPAALSAKIYHTAFAAPRRTGPRAPPHLPPAGGKQAPALRAAFSAPRAENRPPVPKSTQDPASLTRRIFCLTGRKQAQASQTFASADAK